MSSWGNRASYSEAPCDFFFQSDRLTQYQETHSTLNKKKRMALHVYISTSRYSVTD